jgi:uncharacterized secreted protein with C-terminal beta-propeller domain
MSLNLLLDLFKRPESGGPTEQTAEVRGKKSTTLLRLNKLLVKYLLSLFKKREQTKLPTKLQKEDHQLPAGAVQERISKLIELSVLSSETPDENDMKSFRETYEAQQQSEPVQSHKAKAKK